MKKTRARAWIDMQLKVSSEGFDYAFRRYSSFQGIDDPEFHRLREAYVKAAEELERYIGPLPEM